METIISSVVALCMFVAGELQEHRIQDKMSDCLKVKDLLKEQTQEITLNISVAKYKLN
jgi:hypothetical protein